MSMTIGASVSDIIIDDSDQETDVRESVEVEEVQEDTTCYLVFGSNHDVYADNAVEEE